MLSAAMLAGCGPAEPAKPDAVKSGPAVPAAEKRLQALGTEPFWAVEILPGALRYSSPENIQGIVFAARENRAGEMVHYSGTMQGQALSLQIEPGKCSDGMSDTVYAWKATLTIDGKTEQGCARQR